MVRPRPPIRGLLAGAVFGFAIAAASRAQTLRFLEPEAGGRLEAGAMVSVSWTPGVAGRDDADEMELVMSLDGGRSFPLRVTRTLSPDARSFFWRVPALPTENARLALRSGREGEKDSETIRILSGGFAIDADAASSLEEIFRAGGEWRTREALESVPDRPEPGAFRLPEEEIRTTFGSERPAEPPTSPQPARERGRRHPRALVANPAAEPESVPPDSRRLPLIPLRQ
jgi:hypothetical protein